jgi:hypothetical protein
VTSRGCPFKCTFCSKPITGDTWRNRSVENVLGEWRWLVRDLHATEVGITDDIWNRDLKRAKELCRRLIAEGLNTTPWVTVHGMKVNYGDAELYQLMKAAGARRVGFGVESGNQAVLNNIIKKGQTLDMVRDAFRNAKAAGLQTMGFFVLGMPGETEETMEDTIKFAMELDPDLANFMIAAPYPGTRLWDMLEDMGAEIFSHEWQDLAIQDNKAHFQLNDLQADWWSVSGTRPTAASTCGPTAWPDAWCRSIPGAMHRSACATPNVSSWANRFRPRFRPGVARPRAASADHDWFAAEDSGLLGVSPLGLATTVSVQRRGQHQLPLQFQMPHVRRLAQAERRPDGR